MKAKIEVEKFSTPNYVILKLPPVFDNTREFKEQPKLALKDVDVEVLDYLCEEFRRDIFAKANKKDPR